MSTHTVEVTDFPENRFHIQISIPTFGNPSWKALKYNWIRYKAGGASIVDKTKVMRWMGNSDSFLGASWEADLTLHKHLYLSHGRESGLFLYDFMGWTSPNDAGRGGLVSTWAVEADAGPCGWRAVGQ